MWHVEDGGSVRPVRFGEVVVDRAGRRVVRDGEPQHLEPQAFDLLITLLDEPDRVIPKPELFNRVWGDQFVSESALTTRIKEIRRAVGDDGRSQAVIRNVRGRGYQFVAELMASNAPGSAWSTTAFVGRDDALARARDLLDQSRVLTLVGPGGVGKTTLARRVASEAGQRRRDGWILARLAAVADGDSVGAAVRRAAGIDGTSADDIGTLAGLDAVLVVDNCEHVVDAAAELIDGIASVPGRLVIVATSRERLGLPYEQVLPVEVLDRASAIELFDARASAALPTFRADDASRIGELVDALDRLPLAIEMAAAHVPAIALDELASTIAAELDALRSIDRTADDRHRTLGALVAWSERLLTPDQRRVLNEFSVFAGAVGRDDIVGVIDGDRIEVMQAVTELVGKSLLTADTAASPTRYRILATVRAHVAHGRPSRIDERHARWFLQVAEHADAQLRRDAEVDAHRRLDGAADELRAAHAWLRANDAEAAARLIGALDRYAYTRRWTEPAAWAADLAGRLDLDSDAAADVWAALAGEAAHRAEYDRVDELVARVRASGNTRALISALETASDAAMFRSDFDASRRLAIELERVGDRAGLVGATVMGAVCRAVCEIYTGDPAASATVATLDDSRPGLAPSDRGWIEYTRGESLVGVDPDAAVRHYEAALDLAETTGHRYLRGVSAVSLLAAQSRSGHPEAALAAFPSIIDEYRRAGEASHLVTALRNLAVALVRVGDDRAAIELLASLDRHTDGRPAAASRLDQFDDARDAVIRRCKPGDRRAWTDIGATRTVTDAVDAALDHLAGRFE